MNRGIDSKINENYDSREAQAKAMEIEIPKDGYWGDVPSKFCGAVGGAIGGNFVKDAVRNFENNLIKK